ncbi:MAG: rod shape-determining protein MreC [Bacteroidales bacterium]|nr:rod shape-determining protein MreC [Bacteroidales bacterium]
MYNLLVFLKKYNAVLLFLLLEIICIILILNSLPYHNRKFVSISNSISGNLHSTSSNIGNYFTLKNENELLIYHNALLMNELEKYRYSVDTVRHDETFIYIPAHVISNSLNRVNNFILIDKGRLDGIETDMGVICDNGVVGKIVNVSNHYASVMSMLNLSSITSVRFISNQNIASVVWNGDSYMFSTVKDIPAHIQIEKGDTIVTSGYSNTFPAGIMVGTIEETTFDERSDFNAAKMRFSTDFSTLQYVYVVKNNFKAEIDSLCITH